MSLGIPEGVDKACSRSFFPADNDKNAIPCLLTASYVIVSSASGLTGLYLYLYLMLHIKVDVSSLLCGQSGDILVKKMQTLAYLATFFVLITMVPVAVMYSYLTAIAVYGDESAPLLVLRIGEAAKNTSNKQTIKIYFSISDLKPCLLLQFLERFFESRSLLWPFFQLSCFQCFIMLRRSV